METDPQKNKDNKDTKSVVPSCCSSDIQLTDIQTQTVPKKQNWIIGKVKSKIGEISKVDTNLSFSDRLGGWKVRWSFGRNKYRVEPGLYAVGDPSDKSPVFVSANYKLSFDRLRSQLGGIDGWIMVIDTKGINVWCAAGKGTFGTDEIVDRIGKTGLGKVVSHGRIIVPQLGAPGISAHDVKKRSGFRIVYGPVRAIDITAFLQANNKATASMRQVRFTIWDRAILIPNDMIAYIKFPLLVATVLFVLSGFGPGIFSIERIIDNGTILAILLFFGYIVGTVLPPILLPVLPGKSFSVKGIWIGLLLFFVISWYSSNFMALFPNDFSHYAWLFIFPAISSFITMNFTGSSTYTSLSGVLKEMKVAVPIQAGAATIGLILLIIGIFI
ncbi:MAG: acetyl-CoA synthase subunit gamma [candidate division Zixibacteria bacterium]|nr:acetyl-CoA synthase subunit gamma [candidate division Zixibacteria bacterium]